MASIKVIGKLDPKRHSQMDIHDPDGMMSALDNLKERKKVAVGGGCNVDKVWYEKRKCYISIRRLTPKECFRLQGWTDDYFERAEMVNSDSQLYKQAGNGVTVNVVYEIGRRI